MLNNCFTKMKKFHMYKFITHCFHHYRFCWDNKLLNFDSLKTLIGANIGKIVSKISDS